MSQPYLTRNNTYLLYNSLLNKLLNMQEPWTIHAKSLSYYNTAGMAYRSERLHHCWGCIQWTDDECSPTTDASPCCSGTFCDTNLQITKFKFEVKQLIVFNNRTPGLSKHIQHHEQHHSSLGLQITGSDTRCPMDSQPGYCRWSTDLP